MTYQFIDSTDLPHMGAVLERKRAACGLRPAEIAAELEVNPSTIIRFEQSGRSRRDRIAERYIDVLGQKVVGGAFSYQPLLPTQISLLHRIWRGARTLAHQEEQLQAIDMQTLRYDRRPAALGYLLTQLAEVSWPALIIDPLWHIHAVNGAYLNARGIDPLGSFIRTWEAWHVIAGEFAGPETSPSRVARCDSFCPPLLAHFFDSCGRFLFTGQLRLLLDALHRKSAAESTLFTPWWRSASTFALPYATEGIARRIHHPDLQLQLVVEESHEVVPVQFAPGFSLPFTLVTWKPWGMEAAEQLRLLRGGWAPQEIYFAADYDRKGAFHVNRWPALLASCAPVAEVA